MTPELSHACSQTVRALPKTDLCLMREAALLAVAVTQDKATEATDPAEVAAAWVEHTDARTVLYAIEQIEQSVGIVRQAMERDALRSNHPTARILRGV